MEEGDNTNWTRERVVSAVAITILLTAALAAATFLSP